MLVRVRTWTRCAVDIAQFEGMAPKVNNPQDVMLLTGLTRARLDFLRRIITLLGLGGLYLVCFGVLVFWCFDIRCSGVDIEVAGWVRIEYGLAGYLHSRGVEVNRES